MNSALGFPVVSDARTMDSKIGMDASMDIAFIGEFDIERPQCRGKNEACKYPNYSRFVSRA